MPLGAFRIEDQYGRGPGGVETVEPRGMFLDVGLDRQKIRTDETRDTFIRVRLGFQPSASASSGGRAEINQDGLARSLRLGQCRIDVFTPLNRHILSVSLGASRQLQDIPVVSALGRRPASRSLGTTCRVARSACTSGDELKAAAYRISTLNPCSWRYLKYSCRRRPLTLTNGT